MSRPYTVTEIKEKVSKTARQYGVQRAQIMENLKTLLIALRR